MKSRSTSLRPPVHYGFAQVCLVDRVGRVDTISRVPSPVPAVIACLLAGVLALGGGFLLVNQLFVPVAADTATPTADSSSAVSPVQPATAPLAEPSAAASSSDASSSDASSSDASSSETSSSESTDTAVEEGPVDTRDLVSDVVARTNMVRASYQAGPLTVDPELSRAASQWASEMLETGTYQHSSDERLLGIMNTGAFGAVGENLHAPERQCAAAPSCDHPFADPTSGTLVVDWMRSPSHRLNMLDLRWDRIGVGVACSPDGRLWAAVLYASSTPTTTQPELPVVGPGAEPVLQDDGYTCRGHYRDANPKWQHPVSVP